MMRNFDLSINPLELQNITMEDVRRLVRFSHLEAFKRRLEKIPHALISYRELLQVSMASTENNYEAEAIAFVKALDESSYILVLGSIVHSSPYTWYIKYYNCLF
ncbi:hypothetical protein SUGI_0383400 [Cryptomeria japonica]|nr:hypothetical protein SUGI_0383400 [Cryptomeria japonica]